MFIRSQCSPQILRGDITTPTPAHVNTEGNVSKHSHVVLARAWASASNSEASLVNQSVSYQRSYPNASWDMLVLPLTLSCDNLLF